MEELDLEIAADYIYMAALLIHIKSRMLLPRDETAEELEDPRQELVDRLLEYQRFKAVAESFAELDVLRMGMWSAQSDRPAWRRWIGDRYERGVALRPHRCVSHRTQPLQSQSPAGHRVAAHCA